MPVCYDSHSFVGKYNEFHFSLFRFTRCQCWLRFVSLFSLVGVFLSHVLRAPRRKEPALELLTIERLDNASGLAFPFDCACMYDLKNARLVQVTNSEKHEEEVKKHFPFACSKSIRSI